MIVGGNVLGDLWAGSVGVFERIGDVSVYWLALALALKTAVGLHRTGLAQYPARGVPEKWPFVQDAAVEAVAPRAMAQDEAGSCHFSDWRRYAREVALPSGASYRCRIGVNGVFMGHFRHPRDRTGVTKGDTGLCP